MFIWRFFLFERRTYRIEREIQRNRESSNLLGHTPNALKARAGPGWSQESGLRVGLLRRDPSTWAFIHYFPGCSSAETRIENQDLVPGPLIQNEGVPTGAKPEVPCCSPLTLCCDCTFPWTFWSFPIYLKSVFQRQHYEIHPGTPDSSSLEEFKGV